MNRVNTEEQFIAQVRESPSTLSRRELALMLLAGAFAMDATAEDCTPTSAATQGPYWRADAPLSRDLTRGVKGGSVVTVRGTVTRGKRCRPVAGAIIDVWQADDHGKYDVEYGGNQTFLRARLLTDSSGAYEFRTIRPAPYGLGGSMRPAHIHFRLVPPGGGDLVTQMYFSGDPYLRSDPLSAVKSDLVILPVKSGQTGTCQFDIRLS